MMPALEVRGLSKRFGAIDAVRDFSHRFAPGRITTVVGPSGSGKSTTLWMIAGLLPPDGGRIALGEEDLTTVPAEHRDMGMVFQNYALFPHLSVFENIEFGLRVRRVRRADRLRRVAEVMQRVRIEHLRRRRIREISGGEQQRVALARALAIRPRVLLMDEPLSALDAKLRESLRDELFRLLERLAVTTIYVTHDQVEAMSLGHELIAMNQGRIEQAGRPHDIYRRPANTFVAEFLGSANIFAGRCIEAGGRRRLILPFAEIDAPATAPPGSCWVMIRPEDFEIAGRGVPHFHAEVESSQFLGNQIRIYVAVRGGKVVVDVQNEFRLDDLRRMPIHIKAQKVYVWPRPASDGRTAGAAILRGELPDLSNRDAQESRTT